MPKDLIDREEAVKNLWSLESWYDETTKCICFDDALENLNSLPSLSNKSSEWTSVSERLPENGQRIIVNLQPMEEGVEGDIKDARFFSDTLGTRFRVGAGEFVHGMYVKHKGYTQRDTDNILYKVTHWQPLPPPPAL